MPIETGARVKAGASTSTSSLKLPRRLSCEAPGSELPFTFVPRQHDDLEVPHALHRFLARF
eukprot:scaffold146196_cov31-Tisochrysis_lutea.AAC.1